MLNIVTVNWQNYQGRGVEYVNNLFDMVRRNLAEGLEGRFIVFADGPCEGYREGIEVRGLPDHLKGWFNKLYLFKSDLFNPGDRILFFDLDTLITGPVDALALYRGSFAILRDFYRPSGMQSSVMAWTAGEQSEIWNSFETAGFPSDNPGGDQAWIELQACKGQVRFWQSLFPEMFVSYKANGGRIPDKASVVVFHGLPRPHEVLEGWVPRVWKEGGLTHSELKAVCNTAQEALLANVRSASERDLRWFEVAENEIEGHVAIIGGGPSVKDMIEEIQYRQGLGQAVWVLNNAALALKDTGIYFDAQVLLDARPETAKFITDATEYFVASQCDHSVFDHL